MSWMIPFVVATGAVVVWRCGAQMRKMNKAIPRIITSAAFLAISSVYEAPNEDGVCVPVGAVTSENLSTVIDYIRDHFGKLDRVAIDTLRRSIPLVSES